MKIINFASKLGQKKYGVQNTGHYLEKLIDNSFFHVKCKNQISKKNFYNNLNKLYFSNNLFQKKINIGGDHSMSIATVADSLNRVEQGRLKVLWFDAHADINTYYSSKSKNFHGMPLSYLTNLDKNKNFSFIINTLDLNNLMYIGIRDLDNYEKKIIKKYNIQYINTNDFNNLPEKSLSKIINFIKDDPFHLSFDVDCLDPSIISSTGTPVNNGLLLDETKYVLDTIKNYNLINMDIAELNLYIGDKNEKRKSLNNFLYLFNNYLDVKSSH